MAEQFRRLGYVADNRALVKKSPGDVGQSVLDDAFFPADVGGGTQTVDVTETASVTLTESVVLDSYSDLSDTVSLSLGETVDALTYSDLTDSAALVLDESVSTDVIADVTDDAALSVSESADIEVVAEAVDDAALSVTESVELEVIAEQAAPVITGGGADRRRRKKKRTRVYWEDIQDKPAPIVAVEAVAQEESPSRTSLDVPELLELGREIRLAINDELEADDEDILALVAML